MKQSGLKNRFDKYELSSAWAFWFRCLWCGKSGADSFHHIMSSSSQRFKDGSFNSSILNACPIHNEGCHLYNAKLHTKENESKMLRKVLKILLKNNYQLTKKDIDFFKTYESIYEKGVSKRK